MPHADDIYIIPYGSKWGWKYENSIVQKLYPDLDSILHFCNQKAKKEGTDVYVEVKGKFVKQKK